VVRSGKPGDRHDTFYLLRRDACQMATRIGGSGTDRGHHPHNLRDHRARSSFWRGSSGRSGRVRTGVGHDRRRWHPIASSQRAVPARITSRYDRTRQQNRRGACPSGTF
jgi:hypothetical protein